MRHYRFMLLFAALWLIPATATHAQPSRRVFQPRMTQPAIVVLNGNAPVINVQALNAKDAAYSFEITDPASGAIVAAREALTVTDVPGVSSVHCENQNLMVQLPASLAPGLYSLRVTSVIDGESSTETIPRSVWVLAQEPDTVTFAHVSDTHAGDPRAAMAPSAETPDERREKVYRAACASGVDFVILTGDLVSVPGNYKNEYRQAYEDIEAHVSCPVFAVPGNHDLYTTHAAKESADGRTFWKRYFGEERYAFSIGRFTFVITNTYDWPAQYRNFMNQPLMRQVGSYSSGAMSLEQYDWLDQTLGALSGKTTLVFGHHLFRDYSTKNSEVPGLAAPDRVLDLLAARGVTHYFAGHNHRNTEETARGVTLSTVVSAASDIPEDASWGFRKCTAHRDTVSCEFQSVVQRTD